MCVVEEPDEGRLPRYAATSFLFAVAVAVADAPQAET